MTPSEALLRRTQSLQALILRTSTPGAMKRLGELPEIVVQGGRIEMGLLAQGELFTWRSDMLNAALQGARALPSPVTFTPELPPVPYGLYLFDGPIHLSGLAYSVTGVGWVTIGVEFAQFFIYREDTERAGSLEAFVSFILKSGIDVTVTEPEDRTKYSKDAFVDQSVALNEITRFMLASWLWLKQRVMVYGPDKVNRSAAKQAIRAGVKSDVNVVILRRSERGCERLETAQIEWTCQWLVKGHWRQQFYAATGEHRPIWIQPYVKGPDDKPFRPASDTVYAVSR